MPPAIRSTALRRRRPGAVAAGVPTVTACHDGPRRSASTAPSEGASNCGRLQPIWRRAPTSATSRCRARTIRPTAGGASSISRPRREPRSISVKSRAPGSISATRRSCRTSWRSSRERRSTSPTTTRRTTTCSRSRPPGRSTSGGMPSGRSKAVKFDRPGNRPRVLRHPLAHERLHSRLRAPPLRGDRRRRPVSPRQRPAGHLHRDGLERVGAERVAAHHGARSRRRRGSPISRWAGDDASRNASDSR